MKLSPNEKALLEISAAELIEELTKETDYVHVKQCAFQHWSEETKEVFQIQVTITRDKGDFLDAFQTEYMSTP
jgi:hypothetical protein